MANKMLKAMFSLTAAANRSTPSRSKNLYRYSGQILGGWGSIYFKRELLTKAGGPAVLSKVQWLRDHRTPWESLKNLEVAQRIYSVLSGCQEREHTAVLVRLGDLQKALAAVKDADTLDSQDWVRIGLALSPQDIGQSLSPGDGVLASHLSIRGYRGDLLVFLEAHPNLKEDSH